MTTLEDLQRKILHAEVEKEIERSTKERRKIYHGFVSDNEVKKIRRMIEEQKKPSAETIKKIRENILEVKAGVEKSRLCEPRAKDWLQKPTPENSDSYFKISEQELILAGINTDYTSFQLNNLKEVLGYMHEYLQNTAYKQEYPQFQAEYNPLKAAKICEALERRAIRLGLRVVKENPKLPKESIGFQENSKFIKDIYELAENAEIEANKEISIYGRHHMKKDELRNNPR